MRELASLSKLTKAGISLPYPSNCERELKPARHGLKLALLQIDTVIDLISIDNPGSPLQVLQIMGFDRRYGKYMYVGYEANRPKRARD